MTVSRPDAILQIHHDPWAFAGPLAPSGSDTLPQYTAHGALPIGVVVRLAFP